MLDETVVFCSSNQKALARMKTQWLNVSAAAVNRVHIKSNVEMVKNGIATLNFTVATLNFTVATLIFTVATVFISLQR